MNEIQKHLIVLLKEIDQMCVTNGIPYVLAERIAKDACLFNGFHGEYAAASILLRGQDFDRFRELAAKLPDRAIESLREYPDYPGGMSMRYVDESTTFLYGDSAHRYHHKGIFITILKCRNIPKNRYAAKLVNGMEKVIAYAGQEDIPVQGRKKQLAVKAVRAIYRIFGKQRVINRMMDLADRLTRTGNGRMAWVRPMRENLDLPASLFTDLKRVEFENEFFLIPQNHETYLNRVWGSNWKKDTKEADLPARHLLVASAKVSYKEIEGIDSLCCDRARIDEMIRLRSQLGGKVASLRKIIEGYWDLLFMTQQRYEMYRRYYPVREILHRCYEEGQYEYLSVVMSEYLSCVKEYLGKELALTVSPQLDALISDLLRYNGNLAEAEKFERLAKERVLRPVEMQLNASAVEKAHFRLLPPIECDENGFVPAYIRIGERLLPVTAADAQDGHGMVLKKAGGSIVPVAQGLSLQVGDVLLSDEKARERFFIDGKPALLIQYCFGRDITLGWLTAEGEIYISAAFGRGNTYQKIDLPLRCQVAASGEVPLYYENDDQMMRLYGRDEQGEKVPAAMLGSDGLLKMAEKLYYTDGTTERILSAEVFLDKSYWKMKETILENGDGICCRLVQKDSFGRIINLAALYDDGAVLSLVRVDKGGIVQKLPPRNLPVSLLWLREPDGKTEELAMLDAEGKIILGTAGGKTVWESYISSR